MERIYITLRPASGAALPEAGRIIRLFRAENNASSVVAELPCVCRIGTVADAPGDVLPGTLPATSLAKRLTRPVFARILFLLDGGAIAEVAELPDAPKNRPLPPTEEDGLFDFIADVRAVPARNLPC